MQKLMIRTIPILFLLLFGSVNFAKAQNLSIFFGGGSATDGQNKVFCADSQLAGETASCFDKSLGVQVPNAGLGLGPANSATPWAAALFGVFGAQIMIKSHLGVSGEYALPICASPLCPCGSGKFPAGFLRFQRRLRALDRQRPAFPTRVSSRAGRRELEVL